MLKMQRLVVVFGLALAIGMPQLFAVNENEKNIVETAISAKNFKTLVTAVKTAELVETLSGPGPFTVFAPTDEAFDKLGKDTIQAVLKDKTKLTSILKYHVVAGKVTSDQVVKLDAANTLNGKVTIKTEGKNVIVNNAKVIKADIMCSNGVIHVIDTVLLPQAD